MVQFEFYFLLYHWLMMQDFCWKPNRDKEVKNFLCLFKNNKNNNDDYFKWTTTVLDKASVKRDYS